MHSVTGAVVFVQDAITHAEQGALASLGSTFMCPSSLEEHVAVIRHWLSALDKLSLSTAVACLSVFGGSFSLESAIAVGVQAPEAVLDDLQRMSIIRASPAGARAPKRYTMQALVRQAARQLLNDAAQDTAQGALLGFVRHTAERGSQLQGSSGGARDPASSLQLLSDELANFQQLAALVAACTIVGSNTTCSGSNSSGSGARLHLCIDFQQGTGVCRACSDLGKRAPAAGPLS